MEGKTNQAIQQQKNSKLSQYGKRQMLNIKHHKYTRDEI